MSTGTAPAPTAASLTGPLLKLLLYAAGIVFAGLGVKGAVSSGVAPSPAPAIIRPKPTADQKAWAIVKGTYSPAIGVSVSVDANVDLTPEEWDRLLAGVPGLQSRPAPQPTPIPNPAPPVPSPTPPAPPAPAPTPPAPLPPPPVPTPPAPTPAPTFGIAAQITKLLALVADSPTKATEARAIAGVLEALAASIDSGSTPANAGKILGALAANNLTALGSAGVTRWKPFSNALASPLETLFFAGKLKSASDWSALLREIAGPLRSV